MIEWMIEGHYTLIYVCRWREKQSIIVFSFLFLSFSSLEYDRILRKRERESAPLFVLSFSFLTVNALSGNRKATTFSVLLDLYLFSLSPDWCRVFSLFSFVESASHSQWVVKDLQMDRANKERAKLRINWFW